jgi:multidrug efflux pump subunit AcrA (membrane-fusion protein)
MKKLTTILITTSFLVSACGEAKNPHRVVGELASDRIELTAESNEPITAIRFAEGDSVAAGQVLIEQDNTRAAARLAEAEGALAQMRER